MHIKARKLYGIIQYDAANESQKAKALIFIQKHMAEALQTELLAKEDPKSFWEALVDRFDHHKLIFFLQARNNWQNLRFQDFKIVDEYGYEVCFKQETIGRVFAFKTLKMSMSMAMKSASSKKQLAESSLSRL
ncbi:hypothetical protein ACFX15_006675 [Malus domestica]